MVTRISGILFLFLLILFSTVLGPAYINSACASAEKEKQRFTENGEGVIIDNKTGLMWTQNDSYADLGKCLNWHEAKNYVDQLKTGGFKDWRMATVKELKSLYNEDAANLDYNGNKIHIDSKFAPGSAYWIWSSHGPDPCCAHAVNFTYGISSEESRDHCNHQGVLAVRFDQKTFYKAQFLEKKEGKEKPRN